MSVTIKPGAELDRAVAEAIGYRPYDFGYNPSWSGVPCENYFRDFDSGIVAGEVWIWNTELQFVPFRPSTDLNAAFAAAERAALFDDDGPEAVLKQHPAAETTWCVAWEDGNARDGYQAVYKSTPALAICMAILKLKENDHAVQAQDRP